MGEIKILREIIWYWRMVYYMIDNINTKRLI